MQVRVLEPATSLHVSLMIDVRGFTFGIYRDELLELALSALASIAVYLQDAGFPVACYANSQPPVAIAPGASVAHLQHVLESMARLEPVGRADAHALGAGRATARQHRRAGRVRDVVGSGAVDQSARRARASRRCSLLAVSRSPGQRARPGTLYLTPGCDVAALLEGRA